MAITSAQAGPTEPGLQVNWHLHPAAFA